MKNILIEVLKESHDKLLKQIPKTIRKELKEELYNNCSPYEIIKYCEKNNIAIKESYIGSCDFTNELYIYYEVDMPISDKEILKYKQKRFHNIIFPILYKRLTESGLYKRVGFNSSKLDKFRDINIYDLYINNEYDLIEEYYFLYFEKL